jgi:hypothetical protein
MDLRADARIPFPRETVFAAYRDDVVELVPYLTNVQAIEIKSRKDDGDLVEFVNEWRGGGEIPAAVRAFLSESMLSWTDYATWNAKSLSCDWRIETHAFTEAVRAVGHNRFLEDGVNQTALEIRGTFEVDAKKIRGVPRFLAGTVGRTVEDFMVGKIQSNLVETAKSLTLYLEAKAKKA